MSKRPSPVAIAKLVSRARREIEDGLLPSCQLALGFGGEVVHVETLGKATDASRYATFSCTKVVVASAVWQLLGEGGVALDTKVADLVPGFGRHGKDAITVEQLLTYRAGIPRAMLTRPAWLDRALRLEEMAEWRLEWKPGSHYDYHYTSAHWLLAEVIERVTGQDFRAVIHARICEPLGMTRSRLGIPPGEAADVERIVLAGEPATPAELLAAWGVPELFAGEVNDKALEGFNDDADALAAGVPGGGLVSTAADLARFYQALLHNPRDHWAPAWLVEGTQHIRVRDPDILMGGKPANRTLGAIVAGDDGCSHNRGFGRTVGPRAFGHGGVAGQIAWADPDSGLSFAYLTSGRDRHLVREARRGVALSSLAAVCVA
jgi:CubicO group peptidase (beta-lactamase class C family)